MTGNPIYVVHEHPLVDTGEAVYEGPPEPGPSFIPAAPEPIPVVEHTHPVVDGGPADPEPTPQIVLGTLPEPIPPHVFSHPLIDRGRPED